MIHLVRGCFVPFKDKDLGHCFGYLKTVDYEKDLYVFQPLIYNIKIKTIEFEYRQMHPDDPVETGTYDEPIYKNAKVARQSFFPRKDFDSDCFGSYALKNEFMKALAEIGYNYNFETEELAKTK